MSKLENYLKDEGIFQDALYHAQRGLTVPSVSLGGSCAETLILGDIPSEPKVLKLLEDFFEDVACTVGMSVERVKENIVKSHLSEKTS